MDFFETAIARALMDNDPERAMREVTVHAAVAREITCRECGNVLDVSTATCYEADGRTMYVLCGKCHESFGDAVCEAIVDAYGRDVVVETVTVKSREVME